MAGTAAGAAKHKRCPFCNRWHRKEAGCVMENKPGPKPTPYRDLIRAGAVTEANGCISFNGKRGKYPTVGAPSRQRKISRILLGLEPDDPRFALHTCDNNWCIRKDHLYIGDQKQNMRDMDQRGRRVLGRTPRRSLATGRWLKD